MIEFKYRPDVDGLRAVAVLLVLLFHADLGFPGGFVGVDVFFVISGFLITGLLLKEQQTDGFRLSHFWIRRIRRILPASIFVVVATLIAGFFVLLPSDYDSLAKSAIAQQAMLSNVYFWWNTGYFAGEAELKPLLHTWSLGVEEQFYICYPFLVVLLCRYLRRFMAPALIVILIISLGVSEWTVRTWPSATFYLLPMRAWELLLGGVLCFAPTHLKANGWFANIVGCVGVAGIILAAWKFNLFRRFPGASALLPCAGAAMVIYSNSLGTTWVGKLLASKPIVYVGLVSYSLYLWHWPVLSLLRHLYCGEKPDTASRVASLAASFVLAALSLRYIESPFRAKILFPKTKSLLAVTTAMVSTVLALSLIIVSNKGLPNRFDPLVLSYAAEKNSYAFNYEPSTEEMRDLKPPTFGVPEGAFKILVWGDSHAMALISGIDAACKTHNVQGFQATRAARAPLLDFIRWDVSEQSSGFNRAVVDFAIARKMDVVILAGFWSIYTEAKDFEPCLVRTIEKLNHAGIRVVITKDVAIFKGDVPLMLSMAVRTGKDVKRIGIHWDEVMIMNKNWEEIFDRIKESGRPPAIFLDLAPYFVDDTGLWRAEYDGKGMYRDSHHLTVDGSLRLQSLFERLFNDLGMN